MKFLGNTKSEMLKKYTEFLNDTYNELLHRPPDKAGLDHYISELANKKITMEGVRKEILESEERKLVLAEEKLALAEEKYKKPLEELYDELIAQASRQGGIGSLYRVTGKRKNYDGRCEKGDFRIGGRKECTVFFALFSKILERFERGAEIQE